jgi:hypothetical protein
VAGSVECTVVNHRVVLEMWGCHHRWVTAGISRTNFPPELKRTTTNSTEIKKIKNAGNIELKTVLLQFRTS